MQLLSRLLTALTGLIAVSATAEAAGLDQLAPYRWSARVVVASAPNVDDPALTRQRAAFAQMGQQGKSRDLVLIEAVGSGAKARALRDAFDLDGRQFTAVLVGKDGSAKLRSAQPLDAAALFPLIDSMPMRQQEMRALAP